MTETNTSAPMGWQNRRSPKDGLDDFPTPPWATRAFLDHCMPDDLSELVCWEPCANRGYMVKTLEEKFAQVYGSDIEDYGAGYPLIDFLAMPDPKDAWSVDIDWIITNPPFNKAEEFFHHWRDTMVSVEGLALLLRSSWMEGWSRFDTIFGAGKQPAYICPYVGRVAMVQGRLDRKAATQMPYAWFIWERERSKYSPTRVKWIPAKKADYEREEDWPDDNG